jgi:hypothetical protein
MLSHEPADDLDGIASAVAAHVLSYFHELLVTIYRSGRDTEVGWKPLTISNTPAKTQPALDQAG